MCLRPSFGLHVVPYFWRANNAPPPNPLDGFDDKSQLSVLKLSKAQTHHGRLYETLRGPNARRILGESKRRRIYIAL